MDGFVVFNRLALRGRRAQILHFRGRWDAQVHTEGVDSCNARIGEYDLKPAVKKLMIWKAT
jgi:hypothetical protein